MKDRRHASRTTRSWSFNRLRTSDRLDYSVVEKGISNAGEREVRVFKQIAFYLKKVPSLAQTIDWQSQPNSIHAYSDLEHVRCQETRNSTIIAIMIRCKNQSVVIRQSIFLCSSFLLLMCVGSRQMHEDFGIDVKVKVNVDGIASITMLRRHGLGTAKHVVAQHLWTQDWSRTERLN